MRTQQLHTAAIVLSAASFLSGCSQDNPSTSATTSEDVRLNNFTSASKEDLLVSYREWWNSGEGRELRQTLSDEIRVQADALEKWGNGEVKLLPRVSKSSNETELRDFSAKLGNILDSGSFSLETAIQAIGKLALQVDKFDLQDPKCLMGNFGAYVGARSDGSSFEAEAERSRLLLEWSRTSEYYVPGEVADSMRHVANKLKVLSESLKELKEGIDSSLPAGKISEAREYAVLAQGVVLQSHIGWFLSDTLKFAAVDIDERSGDRHFAGTSGLEPHGSCFGGLKGFLFDDPKAHQEAVHQFAERLRFSKR